MLTYINHGKFIFTFTSGCRSSAAAARHAWTTFRFFSNTSTWCCSYFFSSWNWPCIRKVFINSYCHKNGLRRHAASFLNNKKWEKISVTFGFPSLYFCLTAFESVIYEASWRANQRRIARCEKWADFARANLRKWGAQKTCVSFQTTIKFAKCFSARILLFKHVFRLVEELRIKSWSPWTGS